MLLHQLRATKRVCARAGNNVVQFKTGVHSALLHSNVKRHKKCIQIATANDTGHRRSVPRKIPTAFSYGKDNFHFPANTLNTRPGTTLCVRHRCKDTVVYNKRPLIRDKQIKSTHEPVRLKGRIDTAALGHRTNARCPFWDHFVHACVRAGGFFRRLINTQSLAGGSIGGH